MTEPGAVAEDHARGHGADVTFVYRAGVKGYAATIPANRLDALRSDPRVLSIESDEEVHAFDQQTPTGVERIFAPENPALDIDRTDETRVDVDIAVLDTGIAYDHPDLVLAGRTDCTVDDPFETPHRGCLDDAGDDGNGHGTHVAGTAAALDNKEGVVGVAPGARLWAVKVLDDEGSGFLSTIIAGIDWVTAQAGTIEVANMSLGCMCQSEALDRALAESARKGIVYSAAAGNDGQDAQEFSPANHPDVITVSALADFDGRPGGRGRASCLSDDDDTLAGFSNFGAVVEITAPGTCIRSTWPDEAYAVLSGTSMATPHVTGAAALLASGGGDPKRKADVDQIRRAVVAAGNAGWTDDSGDGIQEPLLDVGSSAHFSPGIVRGPFNAAPKARFTRACFDDLRCDFDGSTSSDRDGVVTSYAWSFGEDDGDDEEAQGAKVSHAYENPGVYIVTLTVTDDEGAVGRRSAQVVVRGPPLLSRPSCGTPGDDKCEAWVAAYDHPNGYGREGTGVDNAYDLAVAPDGSRVYITGFSWDNGTDSLDIATAAYDTGGKQLWVQRYSGPASVDDAGYSIAVSPDGSRVYVTGVQDACFTCNPSEASRQRFDAVTLAYDAAQGGQLWVASDGSPRSFEGAADVVVGPDGGTVFIASGTCAGDELNKCDLVTIAYDAATGGRSWRVRYGRPDVDDGAMALDVSPGGERLVVTGATEGDRDFDPGPDFEPGTDFLTVAYDPRTGRRLWAARYTGDDTSPFSQDAAQALVLSPDGTRVFVTGETERPGGFTGQQWDYATVAYDAARGDELWVSRYDGAEASDGAFALAVDPAGKRIYVSGYSLDADFDSDAVTVAYDAASGSQAWLARYKGSGGGSSEAGGAVAASPDGSRVYVAATASANDFAAQDWATLAYDTSTGEQAWVARYNSSPQGTGFDSPSAAAVSPDGTGLYVGGTFTSDVPFNCCQYGIVRYDIAATVTPIMTGLDNPRGLAFAPDGALYVTEAGRGGTSPPCRVVRGVTQCFGRTGTISRLRQGVQEKWLTGLPSLAPASGTEAEGGPQDIVFPDFGFPTVGPPTAYVTMGFGGSPAERAALGPQATLMGKLLRVTLVDLGGLTGNPFRGIQEVADLVAYEGAANPDGGEIFSNPYGLLALPGRQLALPGRQVVADAGANAVVQVAGGAVSTLAAFPARPNPTPIGPPFVDSVATAAAVGPDGALYVSELTGVPFLTGFSRIHRIASEGTSVYATGLTAVVDLAFGGDGTLYALQHASCGPFFACPGSIVRVGASAPHAVVHGGLSRPGAMTIGPDGAFYVSNKSASAGVGEVLRIAP